MEQLPSFININALTKKALKNVFDGFDGLIETNLFSITYLALSSAVDVGFGKLRYGKPNQAFIEQLKQSGAWFAGQKTYQQQKDLAALLVSSDGKTKRPWKEFEQAAQGVIENYNSRWLKTEYNTAIRSARVVSQWSEWQANSDLYPNLKYLPSRAATPREEHKPYYGVVRPIDDDFWVKHLPPSAYNCLCGVEPTDEDVTPVPDDGPAPAPGLDNNPAITGELFNIDTSPYKEGIDAKTKKELKAEAERLAKQLDYDTLNANDEFRQSMENTKPMRSTFKKVDHEELASINHYTSSEYWELNRWLRSGMKDNDKFLSAFKRVLSAALRDMKRFKGVVYRGGELPADLVGEYKKAYQKGEPVKHLAYTSTTRKPGGEFHGNVKMVITSKNGRQIEKLSRFKDEQEILFDAGTAFKVTGIEEKDGKTIIYLEESQ
ncbi:ADP-ribosyltransferase [Larkinella sp. VNQ87]|uniref:ADP-ribosyltransferase n=1 Tax=Larkinella sp. VNQ87 TaxID=3400921 RepID=UPI003C0DC25F